MPVEVVEGSIPESLDGAFCRNGPNPIRSIQKKRYHWFDGRELSLFVHSPITFTLLSSFHNVMLSHHPLHNHAYHTNFRTNFRCDVGKAISFMSLIS